MEQLRFDGRVALITGAGRGLGRSYAKLLAERGAKVVVNDLGNISPTGQPLSEVPADELVAEIRAAGGEAIANCDSVTVGAKNMVATALDHFGRLDILINNAGISGGGLLADIPPADFDRLFDTHYRGTVALIREAWKSLVASGNGRIVNTSSASVFGAPYTSHYASAKAAVYGLTRCLAGEGRPYGLNVNCIMPSAWTRMSADVPDEMFRVALERFFQPDVIAPFIAWLVHTSNTLSGETFVVGGGRAGRVMLLQAEGVTARDGTPEAWVGKEQELLDITRYGTPRDMIEEFLFEMQHASSESRDFIARLNREQMEKIVP